jgi:transcriptional regulator with XRE-family HTH domain
LFSFKPFLGHCDHFFAHYPTIFFLTSAPFSAHLSSKPTSLSTFPLMLSIRSNSQIEQELGTRLKNRRLDLNLSQEEVAKRSGLARRTITAIEHGEGSTLSTLIALLRALDSLDTLEGFLPDPGISPMAMITLKDDVKKYASKPRKTPPPTPWKWGDER